MIRIDGVCQDYPGNPGALAGLDLVVDDGALHIVEGPGGSGKTVLCRLLLGCETPSRGHVGIGGQDIARLSRQSLPFLRQRIGVVFQEDRFLDAASALENVILPLDIAGLPRREAVRRGRAALDRLVLLGREAARPGQLSACERRRLAIARAIVHQPALLIADAPFDALDAAAVGPVGELFGDFGRAGCTVLLTARTAPPALAARAGITRLADQRSGS